jgi:transcriptional regulator with XRE-family HTH domain
MEVAYGLASTNRYNVPIVWLDQPGWRGSCGRSNWLRRFDESSILDYPRVVQYTGLMNLQTIGRLIAEQRLAKGYTLSELASKAQVGRSTLAALEAGKLSELGLGRVARICSAVDLVLEARPMLLDEPLMAHRHLTDAAGRELTKAAIEDILSRGNIAAWRGLVQAIAKDGTGRIARRVNDLTAALGKQDPKVRAFAALLPKAIRNVSRTQ